MEQPKQDTPKQDRSNKPSRSTKVLRRIQSGMVNLHRRYQNDASHPGSKNGKSHGGENGLVRQDSGLIEAAGSIEGDLKGKDARCEKAESSDAQSQRVWAGSLVAEPDESVEIDWNSSARRRRWAMSHLDMHLAAVADLERERERRIEDTRWTEQVRRYEVGCEDREAMGTEEEDAEERELAALIATDYELEREEPLPSDDSLIGESSVLRQKGNDNSGVGHSSGSSYYSADSGEPHDPSLRHIEGKDTASPESIGRKVSESRHPNQVPTGQSSLIRTGCPPKIRDTSDAIPKEWAIGPPQTGKPDEAGQTMEALATQPIAQAKETKNFRAKADNVLGILGSSFAVQLGLTNTMRKTSARLRELKRKASAELCAQAHAKTQTRTVANNLGSFVTLSPHDMGDVVAAEAARKQRWPDEEPYIDFHYYLQGARLLSIATVDPDQTRGGTQPVGTAWQEWTPIESFGQYIAHPQHVVAMSPSGLGFNHGFIYVARHDQDQVLWPIPRIPGRLQGGVWGWKKANTMDKRFPISGGSRRRSSVVCPTSVQAR